MDLEAAERQAKKKFLEEESQATYGGQPPSDDRLAGAQAGWEAAIQFVKQQLLRQVLDFQKFAER